MGWRPPRLARPVVGQEMILSADLDAAKIWGVSADFTEHDRLVLLGS